MPLCTPKPYLQGRLAAINCFSFKNTGGSTLIKPRCMKLYNLIKAVSVRGQVLAFKFIWPYVYIKWRSGISAHPAGVKLR
jgi:hypothetical protein